MRWTHRFRIEAPVDEVERIALAPGAWFSFYPGYRGLDRCDPHWPGVGSSSVVLLGIGPWQLRVHQTVTARTPGSELELEERALGGLWRDRPRFAFKPDRGGTGVTVELAPSTGWWLAYPLVAAAWIGGAFATPRAMRRLKRMVESHPGIRPETG